MKTTKPGRCKRGFLYTGLGLFLLGAGCLLKTETEGKPEYISVPAEEMVSIPWDFGWTPAISVTPGIPFELQGND